MQFNVCTMCCMVGTAQGLLEKPSTCAFIDRFSLPSMQAGDSPLQLPPKPQETSGKSRSNPLLFVLRLLLGSTAGFYYFVLPVYMWIKDKVWPRSLPGF